MLPKSKRLDSKMASFVLKNGKSANNGPISVKCARSKNTAQCSRFSVVVSGKTQKNAVARNRIKRMIREVLEEILKEKKVENGYLCLIFAKNKVISSSREELKKSIEKAVKEACMRS